MNEVAATKRLTSGKHPNGDRFHERWINGTQILAQCNRLGVWNGYVSQVWKCSFTSEQDAVSWINNFPMSEA